MPTWRGGQDREMCAHVFPRFAAQFVTGDKIALFSFELDSDGAATILAEKHYRLVPVEDLTDEDLQRYRLHSLQA